MSGLECVRSMRNLGVVGVVVVGLSAGCGDSDPANAASGGGGQGASGTGGGGAGQGGDISGGGLEHLTSGYGSEFDPGSQFWRVRGIALADERVWFTAELADVGGPPPGDSGGVMSIDKRGGDAQLIVPVDVPQWSPAAIALGGPVVFFSEFSFSGSTTGRVRRVSVDGTGLTTLAPDELYPDALAVDDAHAFWGAQVNPGTGYVAGVRAVPVAGGSIVTLGTAASVDQSFVHGMAIDGANVYWTTGDDAGAVMSAPKAGGSETVIAAIQPRPRGVAVSGDHLYWVVAGVDDGPLLAGGALMRAALNGGTPEVLVPDQDGAFAIAIDETHVYWGLYPEVIRRMTLEGGAVDEILAGTGDANHTDGELASIAVDATHVYFASHSSGVWRIEKP